MTFYASYDPTGLIKIISTLPEGMTPPESAGAYIVIESPSAANNSYVEDGKLVPMPPKPGEYFVFDYSTKQWVDPRTPEMMWDEIRTKRNLLLAASDWTQLPDVQLANKDEWATYRQALRDVTNQTDPFNIVWPTPP